MQWLGLKVGRLCSCTRVPFLHGFGHAASHHLSLPVTTARKHARPGSLHSLRDSPVQSATPQSQGWASGVAGEWAHS